MIKWLHSSLNFYLFCFRISLYEIYLLDDEEKNYAKSLYITWKLLLFIYAITRGFA
jgi:hypothetical protein